MTTKTTLGLVVLAIGLSIIPAFAESETILSPYQQFKNGTPINQIQCSDSKILMESTRNTPACVNESSIEKLEGKGFILVDVVSVVELKSNSTTSPTQKESPQKLEEDLMFQISSNDEFSGELYGHYNPTHLRRPAPYNASQNFSSDHYDLQSISALSSGKSISSTVLSEFVTSSSDHPNAINFIQWMPTHIPDGFELKWIEISQPEVFGDDIGRLQLWYYPNIIEVSGDMLNVELADIASMGVGVTIYPYVEVPYKQERIDWITKDGTSTQVLIEEKYGGTLVTIVESPPAPDKRGFELNTNTYLLVVGGGGLPLEEYERILLNVLERQ